MPEILDLVNASLEEIPKQLYEVPHLKILYLSKNKIETLPQDFFSTFHQLTWLDLRENRLKSLPREIFNHQHLSTLLLENNFISELPMELGFVPKLKTLQLSGNPIVFPPNDVCSKGTKAILEFLRKAYRSKIELNDSDFQEEKVLLEDAEEMSIKQFIANQNQTIKPSKTKLKERPSSKIASTKCYQNNSSKYLEMIPQRDNSLRIKERDYKEQWNKKMCEILNKQNSVIEKYKGNVALKDWRRKTITRKKSATKLSPPFGTNKDENDAKEKQNAHRYRRLARANVDQIIQELGSTVKNMNLGSDDTVSPRHAITASKEAVQKLMNLQKDLAFLKSVNNSSV